MSVTHAGFPVTHGVIGKEDYLEDIEIQRLAQGGEDHPPRQDSPKLFDRRTMLAMQPSSLAFKRALMPRQSVQLERQIAQDSSSTWRTRLIFNMTYPSLRLIFTSGSSAILATAVIIMIIFTVVRGQKYLFFFFCSTRSCHISVSNYLVHLFPSLEYSLYQALSSSVTLRTTLFIEEIFDSSLPIAQVSYFSSYFSSFFSPATVDTSLFAGGKPVHFYEHLDVL